MAENLSRTFKGDVTDVSIMVETPLTGQRDISYATLDYSDHVRKFDIGLLTGAEYRPNRHVGFFGDFTWGFSPYFSGEVPIHFTMRNIYFSFGATYRL